MESNTLSIGTILRGDLHEYQIVRVLGQGSFGITYLAKIMPNKDISEEISATLYVAIKEFFMKEINGRDESTVTCGNKGGIYDNYKRKFAREAGHLNKLNHPHIIKVEELFEANNTIYYTMEYCEGGSLDDLILRKGTITEIECLKFVRQISCALTFMHDHKMLHLDLKPANVMLRANGDAVLIDFGLSKQYDENGIPESSTTIGGGTPGYAPIEQANYQKNNKFPVTMDVYALGATMYKMLTGVRPAEASVLLNEGFPVYELQERNISEHLLSCIIKAMASLKKNRFQSVVEFMNALDDENSVIDNAFAKKEKTEEREDEIINTIEQLQSNGLYKDAYNLCLDCIRRNRQIDYANKKCAELIPLLKLQNKINSRRTVILVTIITIVSTLISIIVYVSSL